MRLTKLIDPQIKTNANHKGELNMQVFMLRGTMCEKMATCWVHTPQSQQIGPKITKKL